MKRQLLRFFMFITLIVITPYDSYARRSKMPPVSIMSDPDYVMIASNEPEKIPGIPVIPPGIKVDEPIAELPSTVVEAPAISPRHISSAGQVELPQKPASTAVPAEKIAILPPRVMVPAATPPVILAPGRLPEKPAGSPAASRPPAPVETTRPISPMEASAQPQTLPEKPEGSPAAARPPELAAPEIEAAPISARPEAFAKKEAESVIEAQKMAPPLSPSEPPISLRPKVTPPGKIAESPQPIIAEPSASIQEGPQPVIAEPVTTTIETQEAPIELPPAVGPIQQQPQIPVAPVKTSIRKVKAPFELQEMDEMEELPLTKKVETNSQGIPMPETVSEPEEERIEFQFENTDLKNVIDQIALLFNVSFITDDVINPIGPNGKSVKEYKLSFRTNKPLSPKAAWNLFTSFLDIAGFTLVDAGQNMYRVIDANKAATAPVPSYIGTDPSTLEDSDQIIRYVYFIENTNITTLQEVIKKIMSPTGILLPLLDLKALLFIDKSYNIKMIMKIVKELDKVNMPQAMAVLKLRRAEASDVADLLTKIMGPEEQKTPFYPGPRKPSSALYFPENTRVIAEKRTNSLIVLGTPEAIEKIETFVKKNIDKDPERPYSPLFHYDLKYADAKTIADIMTSLMQFGTQGPEATKMGGIRGGDRFFKPMKFIPDTTTNRIIIRGDYQDYLAFKEIIDQLDKPQQQIAVEILVLTVTLNDERALGAALRKKEPSGWDSAIGTKATFQTSGLAGQGPVLREPPTPGGLQLLGNLVNLVQGLGSGNTVLSLGFDNFGVWGVLRALEAISTAHVIANPFLVASDKQKATVSVGEIRRIIAATVTSAGNPSDSFGDVPATLSVALTPQINSDGKIVLAITISNEDFLPGATPTTAAKNTKLVQTTAIVSDREVLALGGLIQNNTTDGLTKVPILGDVPILGWLFKNRDKLSSKQNLLILISAQIIDPEVEGSAKRFSQNRIDDYQGMLQGMQDPVQARDPIHNWFFKSKEKSVERRVENFIFKKPAKRKERARERQELLAQTPSPAAPVMGGIAKQQENLASLEMADIKKQLFASDALKNQQMASAGSRHRKKHKHVSLMQADGNEVEVAA